MENDNRRVVSRLNIGEIWQWLKAEGYQVVGPTIRDGAIVYDEIDGPDELPVGWTDEQNGGKYQLKKRPDAALFGYAVGPHSWKKFLFPSRRRLWKGTRDENQLTIETETIPDTKYAFFGVRSCELHAIAIQDKVFIGGKHVDPYYKSHREQLFIIGVNCHTAGGTCFCVSMNTGPRCSSGYDLVLTEIIDQDRHEFVVDSATDTGKRLLNSLTSHAISPDVDSAEKTSVEKAAKNMGRELPTEGLKELLANNYEHPRWKEVASRCMTCANCTMVCPTCFCSSVEDTTDLTGDHTERWRQWDSCFTMDFSYLHGGSVRQSPLSRYRQWMTHKLSTWQDQFGTSGCVGCGRCVTWCPVAIDITEEVKAIRASQEVGTHD